MFAAGIKARLFQSMPRTWNGALTSMPAPAMEQSIYDVGQSIADLWGKDKSQEWVQTVGKTHSREGAGKAERLFHSALRYSQK